MGEGWETRRRRGPGHDWVILKLGLPGDIRKVEVDTAHFKGNYPASCSLEVSHIADAARDISAIGSEDWKQILPMTPLRANHVHIFQKLSSAQAATHVRFNIYPDGGVARLRLFGVPESSSDDADGLERFNGLPSGRAKKLLLDCCGAEAWAKRLLAQRPFPNVEHLLQAADQAGAELRQEDWLEAFRHHPPIGAKKAEKRQSNTARKWSSGEQSVAQKASSETLRRLAAGNREYEAAFGYVFLICATGKTSEEILASLQQRLQNDRETELRIAAEEQRKITRIRLEKLLGS